MVMAAHNLFPSIPIYFALNLDGDNTNDACNTGICQQVLLKLQVSCLHTAL